jgi:hypothetical protein
MPHPYKIAQHWQDRAEVEWPEFRGLYIGLAEPFCFRCGWLAPCQAEDADTMAIAWRAAGKWLDRAHLADRAHGGLDGPQNLVMLCKLCHHTMPSFTEGSAGLTWVRTGDLRSDVFQIWTDYAASRSVLRDLRTEWQLFTEHLSDVA